jgi:hypothetical protein
MAREEIVTSWIYGTSHVICRLQLIRISTFLDELELVLWAYDNIPASRHRYEALGSSFQHGSRCNMVVWSPPGGDGMICMILFF